MAKEVVSTRTVSHDYQPKTTHYVETDDGTVYAFEKFEDEPHARLARRGQGLDARKQCSTRASRLPRAVEFAANWQFGPDGWEK